MAKVTRKSLVIAALCSIVIGAALVYAAGQFWPYDTKGEGYRGDQ